MVSLLWLGRVHLGHRLDLVLVGKGLVTFRSTRDLAFNDVSGAGVACLNAALRRGDVLLLLLLSLFSFLHLDLIHANFSGGLFNHFFEVDT